MEKKYLSRENIVGKQVIDYKAIIIGTVKELSFDFKAKDIGLTITTYDGKEVNVSSDDLRTVGDVLFLKKTAKLVEAPKAIGPKKPKVVKKASSSPSPKPSKAGLCSMCAYQNESTAKFCIKCGTALD